MEVGFNNQIYMEKQTEHIKKRIERFGNKLYLEFGGKLFDDYHAARVFPGFDVNAKVKLLQHFKDQAEIVFCINAADIESNKIRADFGITYDRDLLRTIDNLRALDLYISSVVITRYAGQASSDAFRTLLENRGIKTYVHRSIKGYPTDVDLIVSEQGYGANDYIETTRPLVVITAPGPCSGKLATCLSQLYHENKRGIKAGYAKFETFPVWNIPLKHPVNLAYEAATADLKDVNLIDPFHLEAYGETTVNYNRDIEVFPIVRTILTKITGDANLYRSPTDMGVNMVGYGITDDNVVREAAKQEIIRRWFKAKCDFRSGRCNEDTVSRIEMLMKELDLSPSDRKPVKPALEKAEYHGVPVMAIELSNGKCVTGKSADLMSAAACAVINSIKVLAGIDDKVHLLSLVVLEPILKLKEQKLGINNPSLNLREILITLSICAATNPIAELALSKLDELRGCEAHCSNILARGDEETLHQLGINATSEDIFPSTNLYLN